MARFRIPAAPWRRSKVASEQAQFARELCDRLSSATFDLLMAALNSTTALDGIASALNPDHKKEDA